MSTTTLQNPLAVPSTLRDIIRPQFHQTNFVEESHIKNELGIKLDKGTYHVRLVVSPVALNVVGR